MRDPSPSPTGPGRLLAGGSVSSLSAAVLVVAAFLPWWSASLDFGGFFETIAVTAAGIEEWPGVLSLIAGISALALGIVTLMLPTSRALRGVGLAGGAAGLAALVACLIGLLARDAVLGSPVDPSIGVFVGLVGAAGVLAGGVVVFTGTSPRLPGPAAPPGPSAG